MNNKLMIPLKTAIIFRQALLPISETFILSQASALRTFSPQFVALQPARYNLAVPSDAIYLSASRSLRSRARRGLYDLTGIAPKFHERVRTTNPQLIHAHFATDGTAALALQSVLNIPMLVTLHGYDVATSDRYWKKSAFGRLYLAKRRQLFDRVAMFICISKFIRDAALAAGFPADRLRVHYIGIDQSRFTVARSPRQRTVLFVGRLVAMKGCKFLLSAMRRVQDWDATIKLLIIGDGPLRSELEALSRKLRINCEFLGAQPPRIVKERMSEAYVFCAPSVTAPNGEREGLGIVNIEAQAVGTPVVGFRTGGIPEAVMDGKTGLLSDSGDVDRLSTNIIRFFADVALWASASSCAVNWVTQEFNLHKQTAMLERHYEEILASSQYAT